MSIREVISERMIGNKKRKGENKAGVNEWITMIGNCGSVLFNKETVEHMSESSHECWMGNGCWWLNSPRALLMESCHNSVDSSYLQAVPAYSGVSF